MEGKMIQLDRANDNPAYRCGRLLAVLDRVQRLAGPGSGVTMADRFFGSASSAPALVFPLLVRGAHSHLARLESRNRGLYLELENSIEEIQEGLVLQDAGGQAAAYPRALTLEEQGIFALGYYHQRAHDHAEAAEEREQGS
jgi:CRISPR-associated protein Csd1